MIRLPELVPISDIRQRQNEILASLANGPVILTQHGRAAAVMLSPGAYNRMVDALEDLQDAADAEAARQEPGAADFDAYLARRPDVSAAD
jgi:PHD/YefM family antitoxin component YafN of YafNO toxin-antitoxin module